MRTAVLFGRFCLRRGRPQLSPSRFVPPHRFHHRRPSPWPQSGWKRFQIGLPITGVAFCAVLTPGAFLELAAEGDDGSGKTRERQMLEISRQEIRKQVAEDAKGLERLRQTLYIYWCNYIYEPIATGFRFVHLAVLFLPVIISAPIIWCGRRVDGRRNVRSGTLWWYRFLVSSMERAGPAFIKVSPHTLLGPSNN